MQENKEVRYVSVEDIIPNRFQPRIAFGEKELNELSSSIKQHGVLQPLLLRPIGDKYEIVAGERRYKASCLAGLNNVPAIIMNTDDKASAEIAITENIQRKDLSAIEEAISYKKLLDKGSTQEEVAKKLGIAQSTVANKLRLLSLTEEAQDALLNSKISERHARSLLRIADPLKQVELLNKIMSEKLTVKQTDDEINKILGLDTEPKLFEENNFKVEIPDLEGFLTPEVPEIEKFEPVEENIDIFGPTEEIVKVIDDEPLLTPFEINNDTPVLENPTINTYEEETSNSGIDEFKNNFIEVPEIKSKYTSAIDKTRDFTRDLETEGFNLTKEEFDLGDSYQIVIKIKKDE